MDLTLKYLKVIVSFCVFLLFTITMNLMMKEKPSKRERHHFFNTLACTLKCLEGLSTTIDLRNEGMVTGKIKDVDGFMNVHMEDVVFTDARGSEQLFNLFYVKARNIRYVHFPKDFPIEERTRQLFIVDRPPKIKKPKTLKSKRALEYQQETLRTAYSQPSTSASSR